MPTPPEVDVRERCRVPHRLPRTKLCFTGSVVNAKLGRKVRSLVGVVSCMSEEEQFTYWLAPDSPRAAVLLKKVRTALSNNGALACIEDGEAQYAALLEAGK